MFRRRLWAWFSFWRLLFLKEALVAVRAVWHLAPSPVADFFCPSSEARTAFAGHPGPFTWREAED
jgi:hypothetical protein